tara:strand:+ start:31 stop:855 length:825 start_codon:yes stop_codon:yes gene_type:complete
LNILGIDFEDWYHPELIQKSLTNEKKIPKVIQGIEKILDLLRVNDTLATFFVVGELLEYQPDLIDKIISSGHEIGFHTMHHKKLDLMSPTEFSDELVTFAKLTNNKSKGFRAPTFSLNYSSNWAIDILEKHGYEYDSSIVPAKTSMYGFSDAEIKPFKISANSLEYDDPNGKLFEFPLLVTSFLGKKTPTGGFYLRTLPMKIIKKAIQNYESKQIPATFYIHSWEITPEFMPKISLPFKDSFITYHNLQQTYKKLDSLLRDFKFTSFQNFLSKK